VDFTGSTAQYCQYMCSPAQPGPESMRTTMRSHGLMYCTFTFIPLGSWLIGGRSRCRLRAASLGNCYLTNQLQRRPSFHPNGKDCEHVTHARFVRPPRRSDAGLWRQASAEHGQDGRGERFPRLSLRLSNPCHNARDPACAAADTAGSLRGRS
jgi:hypothetical protein